MPLNTHQNLEQNKMLNSNGYAIVSVPDGLLLALGLGCEISTILLAYDRL